MPIGLVLFIIHYQSQISELLKGIKYKKNEKEKKKGERKNGIKNETRQESKQKVNEHGNKIITQKNEVVEMKKSTTKYQTE